MAWFVALPVVIQGLAVSAATAVLSYLLTPPPPDQEGPRLEDLAATTSAYGKFRTIAYGKTPTGGNIFDASEVYETSHSEEVGGKGGKSSTLTTYTYSQDIALGLGEGEIDGIARIYANEQLIYDPNGSVVQPSWLDFKFYHGNETQLPDPTLQAIHGADDTPAYRGEAYIVFKRFNISEFGNRIPSFRVVTVTDAESEANEYEVECNPDFNTITEAVLTVANMHPATGYMVHGWDWKTLLPGGRENPIGTVTDPYSRQVLFSLNKPSSIAQLTNVYPSFGTLPEYEYGIQTNGDYENILLTSSVTGGVQFFIYSAYSDVLEAQGLIKETSNQSALHYLGSALSDNLIIYGYENYGDATEYRLIYWPITASGDIDAIVVISDLASVIPDWYGSNIHVNTNRLGDLLIYSKINSGVDPTIIKYTHNENIKWIIDVPTAFITSAEYNALTYATYDEANDYWWSAYNGKIWCFSNETGLTIGSIEDISADPNYVDMDTEPSFSQDTKKIYWVEYNVSGDITGSWDTVEEVVEKYDVGVYESSSGLSSAANAYYFYPTNSLFYSSQNVTRDNPSRHFRLQNLDSNLIPISDIFADICDRSGVPETNYNVADVSTVYTEGYRISNLATGRANAAPLQHAYLVDVVDSGGVLKFVQKGKASVASLVLDDIGASVDVLNPSIPIKVNRIMEPQLFAFGDVIYMNPDSNYEPGTQHANRGASINTNRIKLSLPIVFDDTTAKRLIDVILHLSHIERESYELKLMPAWQYLEGGDVIDVTTDLGTQEMQLIKTSFTNGIMEVEAVRVESSVLTSYLDGDSAPVKDDIVAFAGIMIYALLDIPLLRDADDNAGFYSAATSYTEGWIGGVLFKSPDGTAWNIGSTFTSPSIYGTADDTVLSSVSSWRWDTTNEITVQLSSGELSSITEIQALQGFNTVAYGKDGRWEIINFVDATEISDGVYTLSTLIRGRMGTEHNINNHDIGDIFIPLSTSNIQYVGNQLSDLDVVRQYRGVTIGVNLYEDTNITKNFINTGVCLTPLAPQHIRGRKNSSLDLTITWMPRSRYPASDCWSGIASETDDLYDIEFYLEGETIPIDTATVTDNSGRSYIWLRADQMTDIGGIPQIVDVKVWHKSQRLNGRGYEGFGQVHIGPKGLIPYYDAIDLSPSVLFHFRTDEVHGTVSDGDNCPDELGNVTDAEYKIGTGISFGTTNIPSNQSDSLDTYFYCNENNYANKINIPTTSNNICNTGNQFSLSFVMNVHSGKTSDKFIIRNGHFGISILITTGYLRYYTNGTEGNSYINYNVDQRGDGTHHFAFTSEKIGDNIVLSIYRDSVKVSTGTGSVTLTSISQPTSTYLYISPESIYLDDFAFHNQALSQTEIDYLYSQTGL